MRNTEKNMNSFVNQDISIMRFMRNTVVVKHTKGTRSGQRLYARTICYILTQERESIQSFKGYIAEV